MSESPQMYKNRIRKWKLKKNLSSLDFSELPIRGADKPETENHGAVVIQGVEFDSGRVNRFFKRSRKLGPRSTTAGKLGTRKQAVEIIQTIGIPTPRHINSPDPIRIPEELIQIFRQHVDGCRGDSIAPGTSIRAWNWSNNIHRADLMHSLGHGAVSELFGPCFDELEHLVRESNPVFFIYMYLASLKLPPEVGQILLSHVTNLSKSVIGESRHPTRLLLAKLKTMGLQQAQEFASHIISAYHIALQSSLRWSPQDILIVMVRSYILLMILELIEYESVESVYKGIIERVSAMGYTPLAAPRDETPEPPLKTEKTEDDPGPPSKKGHRVWSLWGDYSSTRAASNVDEGGVQLYLASYKKYGPDHRDTKFVRSQLEAFRRSNTRVEEEQ
jgi:hypothetical protein